jgi:hypothetical protein
MATVSPKSARLPTGQPQGAYYTVSISQTGYDFGDSTTAAGGISPVSATDFAVAPSNLDESRRIARGQLRFKRMIQALQVRSNFRVVNIVPTYSTDTADTNISTLAFGLVFENDDFLPIFGTNFDGSTTVTKSDYIRDKIAEVLSTSHTEVMQVYNPTSGAGFISNESITAAAITDNSTLLVNSITVTEVAGFRVNLAAELPTPGAGLDPTAE